MDATRPTSRPAIAGPVRIGARAEAGPLALAAAASVAEVVVSLVEPWPLALAVDRALTGRASGAGGSSPLWLLAAAAVATVVLAVLGAALTALAMQQAESAAERIGSGLRAAAVDRVLTLSLRWHDRTASGEVLSRLTGDVGRVLDALVATVTTLIPDLLLFAGILGVLMALDAPLALLGLAVVPLLAWLTVRQRERVRGAERTAREGAGRMAGTAAELLRSVRTVQAFGRADLAAGLFERVNDEVTRARIRAVAVEARWSPVPSVLLAVGTGAVVLAGGLQVREGGLTIGGLLVVIAYLRELQAPVRGLVRLAAVRAKAVISGQRLEELLSCQDAVPVPTVPVPLPPAPLELHLDRVAFSYTPDRPVLDGFGLTVRAGETVCLLGRSGAGKSTVLQLLLRLYDVDRGTVRVGGVDVRDVDPVQLRRLVSYVPQDPWLLEGTLADNIALGAPRVSRRDVLAAAAVAGVDEFAGRLPQGYDTPLGEAGALLSGGQRRRVAIARAVVAGAPVLLLDEPTASLDTAAAARITDVVRRAGSDRTVLVVTHDLRLAAIADRVVELQPVEQWRPLPTAPISVPAVPRRAVRTAFSRASDPDRGAVPVGPSDGGGR